MVATSSSSAVARITYLVSDVLVDSRPPLPASSKFSSVFNDLSEHHQTKPVFSLPSGADPGTTLSRYSSSSLVSYTASSQTELLNRLLVHLPEFSSIPLVLHVVVEDDLSDVLVLRSTVPFFLFSRTPQQAHDNALLASRLARLERKPVLHAFADAEGEVTEVEADKVPSFLLEESQAVVNGHVLPSDEYVPALFESYTSAAVTTSSFSKRRVQTFSEYGSSQPHTVVFTLGNPSFKFDVDGVLFIDISLVSPLPPSQLSGRIPPSTTRVLVVEQVRKWSTKWTPLYLDVVGAIQQDERDSYPTTHSVTLDAHDSIHVSDILKLLEQASSVSPSKRLQLGCATVSKSASTATPHVPKHESSYHKMRPRGSHAR